MSHTTLFALYVVVQLCGVAIIVYSTHAQRSGWPMGTLYLSSASPIKILAIAAIAFSLIGSFIQLGWLYALGVLVIGFVFNWPVVRLLGPSAQAVCPVAAVVAAAVIIFV